MGVGSTTQLQVPEVFLKTPAEKFIGLCVTCNNRKTCMYRKRRGTDAIYCEMFDSGNPNGSASGGAHDTFLVQSATRQDAHVYEKTTMKGLCASCIHRDVCDLPKPEGGVWHCREYA